MRRCLLFLLLSGVLVGFAFLLARPRLVFAGGEPGQQYLLVDGAFDDPDSDGYCDPWLRMSVWERVPCAGGQTVSARWHRVQEIDVFSTDVGRPLFTTALLRSIDWQQDEVRVRVYDPGGTVVHDKVCQSNGAYINCATTWYPSEAGTFYVGSYAYSVRQQIAYWDDSLGGVTATPPVPTPTPFPSGYGSQCYYEPTGEYVQASLIAQGGFSSRLRWSSMDGVFATDSDGNVSGPPSMVLGGRVSETSEHGYCQTIDIPSNTSRVKLGYSARLLDGCTIGSVTCEREVFISLGNQFAGQYARNDLLFQTGNTYPWFTSEEVIDNWTQTGNQTICIQTKYELDGGQLAGAKVAVDDVWFEVFDAQQELICLEPPSILPDPTLLPTLEYTPTPGSPFATVEPPIGVTPQPTECFGWSEQNFPINGVTNTLPAMQLCIEPRQIAVNASNGQIATETKFEWVIETLLVAVVGITGYMMIVRR